MLPLVRIYAISARRMSLRPDTEATGHVGGNRLLLVGLITLGLALRSYHYFRGPSMWHDEAAVALNVLSKNYSELLGPLTFHEAAPPLFLWIEKAVSAALGDGVYALRLPPFLASCASMLLFAWVAGRLLDARAVPCAVLLFAVSEQLSWHACEAKPYAFDVLTATIMLAVYAAAQKQPFVASFNPFYLASADAGLPVLSGLLPLRRRVGCVGAVGMARETTGGLPRFRPARRHSRRLVSAASPRPGSRAARFANRLVLDERLSRLATAVDHAGVDIIFHL